MAEYIPPNRKRYLTPNSLPVGRFCRSFSVPDSPEWVGILDGVVSELMDAYAWRAYGELTEEEAAEIWSTMVFEAWNDGGCVAPSDAPTPFWDEDSDVDDEFPPDAQPWYGTVPDPEDTQENIELDFVENFLIWSITGFLAIATWEIGAAPAILFSTVAPKFTLAMKRGDFGEVIRILVDGEEAARVDTTSAAAGEVIRVPILADPELSSHNIAIVQVE